MRPPAVPAPIARFVILATFASHVAACASVQRPGLGALVSDRPDFTDGTEIVAPGLLQVESGSTYTRSSDERTSSLGEVLIRAGYHDMGELRVGLNSYTVSRFGHASVRGLEDMNIGTKVKLVHGGGAGSLRPDVAVLGTTSIPTGGRAFRAEKMQPEVKLAMAWELTERVSFSSNARYAWVREAFESWGEPAASGSLGIGLTERMGSYVEYYGIFPQFYGAATSHYLNAGVAYTLTSDLQLDVRVGQGVARSLRSPDHFIGVGFARRW